MLFDLGHVYDGMFMMYHKRYPITSLYMSAGKVVVNITNKIKDIR